VTAPARSEVCFFERDPSLALVRRAGVEAVGTLMLMFAATGSAVVAAGMGAPVAAAVLLHALATSGALVGLIIAFGAVSGGHFNPIITVMQWLGGERSLRCAIAYTAGQLVGAIAGGMLARLVFPVPVAAVPAPSWALTASEIVATAGLMIIVFGCSRAKRSEAGPFAVGAWLTGMIVFTPSSYANPALVIAAPIATGPIVLNAGSAALFVPAQLIGGLIALGIVALAYGRPATAPHS
jgi:glycerol uptake facilitator-like aquaporin